MYRICLLIQLYSVYLPSRYSLCMFTFVPLRLFLTPLRNTFYTVNVSRRILILLDCSRFLPISLGSHNLLPVSLNSFDISQVSLVSCPLYQFSRLLLRWLFTVSVLNFSETSVRSCNSRMRPSCSLDSYQNSVFIFFFFTPSKHKSLSWDRL